VDERLVAEVDASLAEVSRGLGKVKSGCSVRRKAPALLIGAVLAVALLLTSPRSRRPEIRAGK